MQDFLIQLYRKETNFFFFTLENLELIKKAFPDKS